MNVRQTFYLPLKVVGWEWQGRAHVAQRLLIDGFLWQQREKTVCVPPVSLGCVHFYLEQESEELLVLWREGWKNQSALTACKCWRSKWFNYCYYFIVS